MEIKKILITGGSRGIGRSIIDLFHQDGVEIHAVSRNFQDFQKYNNLRFHSVDLSNANNTNKFAKQFLKKHGEPDLLINNAGTGAFFEWKNFPFEEIDRQINLLFVSPVILCRVFAPGMKFQNSGVIVNISSLATLYPVPYMPLYNAGKSALSSFSQSLMLEYESFPRVIDARFGDFKSEFNKTSSKQDLGKLSTRATKAWEQIELQLVESPPPLVAAKLIKKAVLRNKSSVIYGGGFFQGSVAPFLNRLLPTNIKLKILNHRYFKK